MAGSGGRRKRLSAQEGRRLLLDAGREMVGEAPSGPPLEHIRLTEVARRAGVTAGALYHYWDTQEDYRDDLLDDLFSPAGFPESGAVGELLDDPAGTPLSIEELVRVAAEAEFRTLGEGPDLRVLMAMWAADDPEVNPRIGAQYRAVGDRWATTYEEIFRAYGLEMRPPFTFASMAALFTAIGDGLVVRASVDPASVPTAESPPVGTGAGDSADAGPAVSWNLLGCALLALLPAVSRPVGDDEDLWGLIDRLRESTGQFDPASAGPD